MRVPCLGTMAGLRPCLCGTEAHVQTHVHVHPVFREHGSMWPVFPKGPAAAWWWVCR